MTLLHVHIRQNLQVALLLFFEQENRISHCGFFQESRARQLASTTEAELIAFAGALFGETLNLHTMVESVDEIKFPISYQQDNQAAIAVIQSGYTAKLRHAGRVHS